MFLIHVQTLNFIEKKTLNAKNTFYNCYTIYRVFYRLTYFIVTSTSITENIIFYKFTPKFNCKQTLKYLIIYSY